MHKPSIQHELVLQIAAHLTASKMLLSSAESCTGGLLASILTSVPGASHWYERGFVTYSLAAKQECLHVKAQTLFQHGAVSKAVALEMATGALRLSNASLSVAITGIAGPTGGTHDKPVGTVWLACAQKNADSVAVCHHFQGDRNDIRAQAVTESLQLILTSIGEL